MTKELFPDVDRIAFRYSKTQDNSLKNRFEKRVQEKELENRADAIRQVLNDLLNTADEMESLEVKSTLHSIENGIESIQLQLGNHERATEEALQEGNLGGLESQINELRNEIRSSLQRAVTAFFIQATDDPNEAVDLAKQMFPNQD